MTTVHLPYNFHPRDYQIEAWNAFMHPEFKRGVIVHPRRNGKDLLSWNVMIAKAMEEVGLYYYIAPYYTQIRQIIWEGFDDNGRRFLDYVPSELIKNMTKNDMRIDLANGSQVKMQGSDEINRIVGTNPRGIVFTEYSLHKPAAWEYLRPILANNGGWALFNGTPRGKNHLWDVFDLAGKNSDWFSQLLTCEDTGYPSKKAIQAERDGGMPKELINQEFYCSFLSGSVGAYVAEDLEKVRDAGRITHVPWNSKFPVHTACDPGNTYAVWFFQIMMDTINWIDYYSSRAGGLPQLIKTIKNKPYVYGTHVGPWDLESSAYESDVPRIETARNLGVDFTTLPKLPIMDGVEAARAVLPRSRFDVDLCHDGLFALEHHRAKVTGSQKTLHVAMTPDPATKWASHAFDAFRYGATAIQDHMIDDSFRAPQVHSIKSITANQNHNPNGQLAILQQIQNGDTITGGETFHPRSVRSLNG